MPRRSISVPHYPQERDNSCLPACVRMALAFYGTYKPEDGLRHLFKTKGFGTHVFNVMLNLPALGYTATVETGTLYDIRQLITQGRPGIVHLWTEWLSYWKPTIVMHSVVVVGFDEDIILVNDPAFQDAPQRVPMGEFLRAWAAADHILTRIERA